MNDIFLVRSVYYQTTIKADCLQTIKIAFSFSCKKVRVLRPKR